jgi:hypothetical protein
MRHYHIEANWLVVIGCLGMFSGCFGPSQVTVSQSFEFKPPIRITVLDFDWSAPEATLEAHHTLINYPNAGKYAADSVSNRLLGIDGFEILERSKLRQLLREKGLTQTELVRSGDYEEIGKFLGVDYLVLGTVNSYFTAASGPFIVHTVSFSCRCVDIRSSNTIWSFSGHRDGGGAEPANALSAILNDAMLKLKTKLHARRIK